MLFYKQSCKKLQKILQNLKKNYWQTLLWKWDIKKGETLCS